MEQKKLDSLVDLERVQKEVKKKSKGGQSDYHHQKTLKSLKNKQAKLEAKIADLEREIKAIDFELEINYDATIAQPNFFDQYTQKKNNLTAAMEDWESITEELMEIEG